MSSITVLNSNFPSTFTYGTDLGPQVYGTQSLGESRLPTEPLGSFVLQVQNIVAGSEYGIFVSSTNAQATGVSSALNVVPGVDGTFVTMNLTLDYFSTGNALNNLKIRVRRGTSSQKYLPFETFATAGPGTVPVYVIQVPDTIA